MAKIKNGIKEIKRDRQVNPKDLINIPDE